MTRMPNYVNGRVVAHVVKTAKAAFNLFTRKKISYDVIKDGILIHKIKENQFMIEGVELKVDTIINMIWKIDRAIGLPMLKFWIESFKD